MPTLDISSKILKRLYAHEGLSAQQIASQFSVSIDAVYYLLRRLGIPRRGARDQNRIRFERSSTSFQVKKRLSPQEQKLLIAGVMLYWGEGSQWEGEKTVDFANSKPEMVQVFTKFLRVICGVNEQRLRGFLYCYSNQSPNKLIQFWSNVTGIPKKQFTKPYIKKATSFLKDHKMPYGLLHVRYSDKRLLLLMRKWIKIIPQKLIDK